MSLKTILIAIALSIICLSCTTNSKNNSNQVSGQKANPKIEYDDIIQDQADSEFILENPTM